jgi:lysophospholipase L1-like esterase
MRFPVLWSLTMTSRSKQVFQALAIAVASAAAVLALAPAHAAEAPVGIVAEPCPAPIPMPPELRERLAALFLEPRTLTPEDMQEFVRSPQLGEMERENRRRAALDWPGLCRYRADNQALLGAATATRVVFMGDSITENWVMADPGFFQNGIVGRGIGGQTTPQMLVRFRSDVVALRPQVVHIMAGTNDIAGNTGPTTAQDYKNNIMSMVELAKANGIDVILGSIPPAAEFSWRPGLDPVPRIKELNDWLRSYAAKERLRYIDYHTALAGPAGELKPDLGNDGVHPNRSGYAQMRRLIEPHVAKTKR